VFNKSINLSQIILVQLTISKIKKSRHKKIKVKIEMRDKLMKDNFNIKLQNV